jgi:hypothetical protein
MFTFMRVIWDPAPWAILAKNLVIRFVGLYDVLFVLILLDKDTNVLTRRADTSQLSFLASFFPTKLQGMINCYIMSQNNMLITPLMFNCWCNFCRIKQFENSLYMMIDFSFHDGLHNNNADPTHVSSDYSAFQNLF